MNKKENHSKELIASLELRNQKKSYFYLFVILFLTAFVYYHSLSNNFIVTYDDNQYILNNSYIKELSVEGIKKILFTKHSDNYSPITEVLYAFQYHISGPNPRVFHMVSLLFHLMNIALVFVILSSLFETFLLPLAVTALFALNPMQSESVLWASAASTLYYTFFYLLSIWAYMKFNASKKMLFSILSFVFFLFSILSKVAAVSLPLVLLAIDYSNNKLNRKTLFQKLPFFLVSLIVLGFTFFLKKDAGAIGTYILEDYSFLDRILIVLYSFSFYIIKCVIPFHLAPMHFYPTLSSGFLPAIYYFLPFFIGFIIYRIYLYTRKKQIPSILIFSFIIYTACIIPHLQLVPVGGMVAERYPYLASLGVFIAFFYYIQKYLNLLFSGNQTYLLVALLLPFIIYAIVTLNRSKTWENGETLFTDLAKKYPEDYYSWFTLGFAKYQAGDYAYALNAYDKSIEINKKSAETYTNRGNAKLQTQDFKSAMEDFNVALELNPHFTNALNNRGVAKAQLGLFDSALSDLNLAIKNEPFYAEAYNTRGNVLQQLKNYPESIKDFTRSLYCSPNSERAYFNRGNAAQLMKAFPMAIKDYSEVISLNPKNNMAYLYRGNIFFQLKDKGKA